MSVIDNPRYIALYRFKTLIVALKLEIKGMKMNSGPTAYSILKRERGYKGNLATVLCQAEADYELEYNKVSPL